MKFKVFFCLIFFTSKIFSSYSDYIYPFSGPTFSNYGGLGIIQNPNARFLNEGSLSISWSHNEPYLRGSIVAYPFNWMEASFQYTDINNSLYSTVSEFSGSQSLKDKSFDFKFRILQEKKYLPSVAIGIRDFGGTGLFGSEYIVASKFFKDYVDVSIGIGWGNLDANKISNPLTVLSERFRRRQLSDFGLGGKPGYQSFFTGQAGYFGGIEYIIPNFHGIGIKLEYDGTNYDTEGPLPVNQASKINFGATYPVSKNFRLKLGYTKGNTINFGFSYQLSLASIESRKIVKESKPTIDNADLVKVVTARSDRNLYRASLKYLRDNSINLQKATLSEDTYEVVFSQSKYRNPALAAGRVIGLIDDISPSKVKNIRASAINGGLGIYSIEIDRESYRRYLEYESPIIIKSLAKINDYSFSENGHSFNPEVKYPALFYTLQPEIRSQIGGPDGFYFGDLKLNLDSEVLFKRNISLISVFSYGVYDNMDDLKLPSDSILPHVRTDIVKYLKESRDFSITRMQLNHYSKPLKSIYFKLSAGIFESMFSGYGFEALYKPFYKNYGIGFEAWKVYQRDFDQLFTNQRYQTITGHLSLYYHHDPTDILFKFKGGRYLAKDSGFTIDLSREFISGLRVGAFFSLTDISEEEFGEGSFDKGFYFWVPIDLFTNRYVRRTFGWGLRPITRDGAQTLIHGYPLWGVTNSASNRIINENIRYFYD